MKGKCANHLATEAPISDHSLIYIQRKISIPRNDPKVIKTRQFKHYSVNNFKSDIFIYLHNGIFWDTVLDPNIMWKKWKTTFLSIADFHAPETTKKVRSEYAPWITNNIREVMKQRDFLKKKQLKQDRNSFMMPIREHVTI